jgi:methylenetetrahydrofolate--tRNA-(uracil-5-)-methyltransferase
MPRVTMMGSLFDFISTAEPKYFQPMPPNFGIFLELPTKIKSKQERFGSYRDRSLTAIDDVGRYLSKYALH